MDGPFELVYLHFCNTISKVYIYQAIIKKEPFRNAQMTLQPLRYTSLNSKLSVGSRNVITQIYPDLLGLCHIHVMFESAMEVSLQSVCATILPY